MSSVLDQTPDSAATHDPKDTSDAQWQEQQQQQQHDLPSTTQDTSQIVQTDPDAAQNDGQQPTTPLTPAADDAPALPNNKLLPSDADSSSSLSPAPSSPSAASASVQKPSTADVLSSPADDTKPETSTDPAVGESKEHGDITRERPHAISAPQPDSDSQALNPKQGAAQVNGDPAPSTDRPSANSERTSPDSVSDVDGAAKVDAVLEINFELGRIWNEMQRRGIQHYPEHTHYTQRIHMNLLWLATISNPPAKEPAPRPPASLPTIAPPPFIQNIPMGKLPQLYENLPTLFAREISREQRKRQHHALAGRKRERQDDMLPPDQLSPRKRQDTGESKQPSPTPPRTMGPPSEALTPVAPTPIAPTEVSSRAGSVPFARPSSAHSTASSAHNPLSAQEQMRQAQMRVQQQNVTAPARNGVTPPNSNPQQPLTQEMAVQWNHILNTNPMGNSLVQYAFSRVPNFSSLPRDNQIRVLIQLQLNHAKTQGNHGLRPGSAQGLQAGMHNNPRQFNLIQQQQAQAGRTAMTGSMLPPQGFPNRISPPAATPLSHTVQLAAASPQITNHQRTPSNPAMGPPGDLLGQQTAMRNIGPFIQQSQQMIQPPQHGQLSTQGFTHQQNLGGMSAPAGSWSATNGLDQSAMTQQLAGGATQMQGINYGMMNGMMGGIGQPLQHQWSGQQSGVNATPSMTGLTPAAILQQQQQQPKPAATNVPTTIDPSMFMNWSDLSS